MHVVENIGNQIGESVDDGQFRVPAVGVVPREERGRLHRFSRPARQKSHPPDRSFAARRCRRGAVRLSTSGSPARARSTIPTTWWPQMIGQLALRKISLDHMQIGAADTAAVDFHPHLPGLGLGVRQFPQP